MARNAFGQEQEITLSSLQTITATELSTLLRTSIGDSTMPPHTSTTETKRLTPTDTLTITSPDANPTGKQKDLAIIDVRDSDHIGGHIKTSRHVPSATLGARMPELVRELQDVPVVVFHCALSQQRGPTAALSYLRERRRIVARQDPEAGEKQQKVFVLQGGFQSWQEL